jgi:hypothetical protein
MSLLAELQSRGVTTEDLEKAASVRLFEKAAAAEGVNLDNLSEDQVISLFEQFVSAPTSSTKEASAMNNEIVELFEKTAAAEGIDLDEMSDEDLAELYEHYVENVLPLQLDGGSEKEAAAQVFDLFQKTAAAEGIDLDEMSDDEIEGLYEHYVENVLPLQIGDEDAEEKVADAQEKLAEAEILGRHMARAYADEIDKVAAEGETMGARAKRYAAEASGLADFRRAGGMEGIKAALRSADASKGETAAGHSAFRKAVAKRLGMGALKGGGSLAAIGGTAYGVKKMLDRKKGQTKKASFTEMEVDALLKIAAEAGEGAAAEAKESFTDRMKRYAKTGDEKVQNFGRYIASIGAGEGVTRGGPGVHRAIGYGLPSLAVGGTAYGVKKMLDRNKGQTKKASYDYDDAVDELAIEMLRNAGYDV